MRVVVLALFFVAGSTQALAQWPPCTAPEFDTQGHRGARAQRPENTLPAMEYALRAGVRTLEMDLVVTRDDELVLSHEPHLLPEFCLGPDGTPARGAPIRSLTRQELKKYDCGARKNSKFPAQQPVSNSPPPTFKEVVEFSERASGRKIRYNIEAKSDPSWDQTLIPAPETFARLLHQSIAETGISDRVIIQSFDARILAEFRKLASGAKTALLVAKTRGEVMFQRFFGDPVAAAAAARADILSPQWRLVNRRLVKAAHDRGIAVIPFTVNDAKTMKAMIAAGVDGIISDDVDMMMKVVRELQPAGQGLCF